jgi:hypothetical protein
MPGRIDITNLSGDAINQNFTAYAQPVTISGTVDSNGIGFRNVELTLDSSGVIKRTAMPDVNGNYTITVYPTGTYTLTPIATYTTFGYRFVPSSATITNPTGSSTQNFTYSGSTRLIGGTVIKSTGGVLIGVTVTMSGTLTGTTVTGLDGKYQFTVNQGGSYTINVVKTGYKFSPPATPNDIGTITITDITSDQLAENFTSYLNTYTISGTIYNYDQITPLTGVTVTCPDATPGPLPGGGTFNGITGTNGQYAFTVNVENLYTVTPTKSGYTFIPSNRG